MELEYIPHEQQIKNGDSVIDYWGMCNVCFQTSWTRKCNTCIFHVCVRCKWKLNSKKREYIKPSTQRINQIEIPLCPQCKELLNYKDLLKESEEMILRMRKCIKDELEGNYEDISRISDSDYPDTESSTKAYQELNRQEWLQNGPNQMIIKSHEDTLLSYTTRAQIIFETYKDKDPQVVQKYEFLFSKDQ